MKYKKEKIQIKQCLVDKLKIDEKEAQQLLAGMEKALVKGEKDFFYHVQYMMHFRNDPQFAQQIFHSAIENFSILFLKADTEKKQKRLKDFFLYFFEMTFLQQCHYAKKIEKRRDVSQKILQHMSNQLNNTLETQQLMIANISHDMRTSLNAIIGYVMLLEDKKSLSGEDKVFLSKAKDATFNLRNLVTDILDITKINAGQMEIKEEAFWLDEMIIKSIDSIALHMKEKKLDFNMDIDFFPTKIIGDRQHVMEVLINILSNAVKYTDYGKINLRVKKQKKQKGRIDILFSVEDTGIGMSKEQIENIFEPYRRFQKDKKGVGLGLHIASKLISKLNGKISVESQEELGSIFSFIITFKEERYILEKIGNRKIFFLNASHKTKYFKQKKFFLEKNGMQVEIFNSEKKFINYLLNLTEETPYIISIIVNHKEYVKYDALIYYLKTLPNFQETLFIAERTQGDMSLGHFDKIYEYFSPISDYFEPDLIINTPSKKIEKKILNNTIRVLAIDDMETNLEILKMFLLKRYPSLIVDLAGGGHEAIGMYKINQYDVVFLDLKMPGLNGFEVLQKLQKIDTLSPVYALTADIYKSTYTQVMQKGFTGLLEKPLQLEILYKIIEKVVNAKNT